MGKEHVVQIYITGYYLAIKKNEITPSVATWVDLEMVILSEVGQEEKYRYHRILLIGIIKNDANELIYKMETDSQT